MEFDSECGVALRYAKTLARSLHLSHNLNLESEFLTAHPAAAWADCGLMTLTGAEDGSPQLAPLPLPSCADAVLALLVAMAPHSPLTKLRGAALLCERAAISGLRRQGTIAPGGGCRLLPARDAWIAVNLVRDEDWALVPAWLECDAVPVDWSALAPLIMQRSSAELLERARWLGLAVALEAMPCPSAAPWFQCPVTGQPRRDRRRAPRVLDLSALWAGPLCGQLLREMGAEVVKLESVRRPDGARFGPQSFFDRLNAGKASVALDLQSENGCAQLRALIAQADIVIEASRPRALRQLGIDAEACVREQPGLTWVSLTGYGRDEPEANWIGFGDDAGVAAGLSALMVCATGTRCFVGDALGDPFTGLHAALAAWTSDVQGGGRLLSISLRGVLQHVIQHELVLDFEALRERHAAWMAHAQARGIAAPQAPAAAPAAPPLGADTAAVLQRWSARC